MPQPVVGWLLAAQNGRVEIGGVDYFSIHRLDRVAATRPSRIRSPRFGP
jgi:hypothetical protein